MTRTPTLHSGHGIDAMPHPAVMGTKRRSIDGTKALLVSSPVPRDRTPVLAAQLQRGQRGCQDVPVVRMRFDDREVLMVEVYNDVAVRRCPLALSESLAMLSEA